MGRSHASPQNLRPPIFRTLSSCPSPLPSGAPASTTPRATVKSAVWKSRALPWPVFQSRTVRRNWLPFLVNEVNKHLIGLVRPKMTYPDYQKNKSRRNGAQRIAQPATPSALLLEKPGCIGGPIGLHSASRSPPIENRGYPIQNNSIPRSRFVWSKSEPTTGHAQFRTIPNNRKVAFCPAARKTAPGRSPTCPQRITPFCSICYRCTVRLLTGAPRFALLILGRHEETGNRQTPGPAVGRIQRGSRRPDGSHRQPDPCQTAQGQDRPVPWIRRVHPRTPRVLPV